MTLTEKVKNLLDFSVLFTDQQKQTWLGLLPKMNEIEMKELYGILKDEVVELKKEGILLIEDERLEADLLGLEEAMAVKPFKPGNIAVPVSIPAARPAPPTAAKPMPAPRPAAVATMVRAGALASIAAVETVEDLKKIGIVNLRQSTLKNQIELIKSKIINLIQTNKILPFYAVQAFEASPLFRVYLTIGANLIANTNPERNKAYVEAAEAASHGGEVLTREEFEAIADLRKQIEQL